MKVNVNIKLWNDYTSEALNEIGLTPKFIEVIAKAAVEKWLEDNATAGCEHSVDVEVTE